MSEIWEGCRSKTWHNGGMGWRKVQPDLRIVWPSDKVTEYFLVAGYLLSAEGKLRRPLVSHVW